MTARALIVDLWIFTLVRVVRLFDPCWWRFNVIEWWLWAILFTWGILEVPVRSIVIPSKVTHPCACIISAYRRIYLCNKLFTYIRSQFVLNHCHTERLESKRTNQNESIRIPNYIGDPSAGNIFPVDSISVSEHWMILCMTYSSAMSHSARVYIVYVTEIWNN